MIYIFIPCFELLVFFIVLKANVSFNFRYCMTNCFVFELNFQVGYAFSLLESKEHSGIKVISIRRFLFLCGKHTMSKSLCFCFVWHCQ